MKLSNSLAAVFSGTPGQIELQHLATPCPRGGEILVRIESCTLCGSDLHSFEGRRKVPTPTILGHEIVGRIETFGPDAVRIRCRWPSAGDWNASRLGRRRFLWRLLLLPARLTAEVSRVREIRP